MRRFQKILVATDTRFDDHPIVLEAAELARHNGATLKVVDCVPEFSWTVRRSLPDHEHMRQLAAEEKQQKLNVLADSIRSQGIAVESKVLFGKASIEIIREVLREKYDLVMRVAKGRTSRHPGFFGRTGTFLLRKCPCPVWLVAPGTVPEVKHVAGCVDTSSEAPADSELNDQVYELASSISHYYKGQFSMVHAWSIYGEDLFRGRMASEEFQAVLRNGEEYAHRCLDRFLAKHDVSQGSPNVHLIKGEPFTVIPSFVKHHNVDLLVMGTVARSGLNGLIMGNTAEQILSRLECSVLALKPQGFVSPVGLQDTDGVAGL